MTIDDDTQPRYVTITEWDRPSATEQAEADCAAAGHPDQGVEHGERVCYDCGVWL